MSYFALFQSSMPALVFIVQDVRGANVSSPKAVYFGLRAGVSIRFSSSSMLAFLSERFISCIHIRRTLYAKENL
jgi:hypothetical protein